MLVLVDPSGMHTFEFGRTGIGNWGKGGTVSALTVCAQADHQIEFSNLAPHMQSQGENGCTTETVIACPYSWKRFPAKPCPAKRFGCFNVQISWPISTTLAATVGHMFEGTSHALEYNDKIPWPNLWHPAPVTRKIGRDPVAKERGRLAMRLERRMPQIKLISSDRTRLETATLALSCTASGS